MSRRTGSVLVGLLWCLALLATLVIGVLHTASVDLRVVKNYGDQIQAHYLALAGVEKAKALLYQDALERRRSARNHTGQLADAPRDFKDVPLGRGQFRVFYQGRLDQGGGVLYGISDEESRLNINQAAAEELAKIHEMTPDVVAAIVDWRDDDDTPSSGGAEAEYYASLQPPYQPRNGPFQTTRELLMVRGISREQFAGEDANLNGLLDPGEDDGSESDPPDNRDGILDDAWSSLVTVDSSVRNVSAAGQARVNVKSADESSLSGVPGLSAELAKAIVAGRGQNQLESLADLLEVRAVRQDNPAPAPPPPQNLPPQPGSQIPGQPTAATPAANPAQQAAGPKLLSEEQFMDIADELTVNDSREERGLININTAGAVVLQCLPGITPELAQAIIAYRQSSGFLPNVAWLLKVPGIDRQLFKQIAPKISTRSETFRILSEGQLTATGARKRIQVIVHIGASDVETLSYREDL